MGRKTTKFDRLLRGQKQNMEEAGGGWTDQKSQCNPSYTVAKQCVHHCNHDDDGPINFRMKTYSASHHLN